MSERSPHRTHSSISVASGLQHISKFCEDRDIQSLQKWLKKMGASLPDTTTERHFMDNQKPKYVPLELKGRITKNLYKKKETEPDWKGTLMFKGEVINFGVWNNNGPYGEYFSLKVNDPDWNKDKQQYPKDVTPDVYPKDSDIPF